MTNTPDPVETGLADRAIPQASKLPRTANAANASAGPPPDPQFKYSFDVAKFTSTSLGSIFARLILRYPTVHRYAPIVRLLISLKLRHKFVWRFDEVQEVLRNHRIFEVPFGEEVKFLNGGPNFLLGMADGPDYQRVHREVSQVFKREDARTLVAPLALDFSRRLLVEHGGEIDAMQDLITLVPSMICEAYYGVPIPNKIAFAQWTMAMSSSLFGPPSDDVDKAERIMGRAGGERVSAVVDRAIADAKAAGAPGDTVLARLIRLQAEQRALQHERALTDVDIRSYLIGMITGFVPTNTIAAGNLLVMLLRRPDFMARAQAAVDAGDDDLLKRCLFEAMRFQPLNPGPFRVCTQDYRIAAGTPNEQLIKAGRKVLAGTQYAMFDETRVERPHEFDPDRPSFPYMMFGYGLHWCIGACLAEAQITQTFKALLERGPLEADVRKARYFGLFPGHLTVKYE